MRISRHKKLNLIDNYIAIYRVLYNCKSLLMSEEITKNKDNVLKIQKLCDQTLDLKSKYEGAFAKLKMIDPSFLLLKQQLNDCKGYTSNDIELCSISEICDSLIIIENDYLKLKL